jgi:2-polyprenyl-3-methyl-5-hydroxy-6-metoxy-1,4-benzoquinol methylase
MSDLRLVQSGDRNHPKASSEEAILYKPSIFSFQTKNKDFDTIVENGFKSAFETARSLKPHDEYFLDRVGSAIFYRIPFFGSLGRDLSTLNAVEIGCGRGTKSVCWAPMFKSYRGFDINGALIAEAREFSRLAGCGNIQFQTANAADVLKSPLNYGIEGRIDCIIIYAVLEHLTLLEREVVLSCARDTLAGHGLLIVCEAPNRLMREDPHSSNLPFFQMLPHALATKYIARSTRPEANALAGASEESLYRFGAGVSFHEFDLFLEDDKGRLPAIIGGGWDMWSAFDEPIRGNEVELDGYIAERVPHVDPAFSRYWIDVAFDFSLPSQKRQTPRLVTPFLAPGITHSPQNIWMPGTYSSVATPLVFDCGSAKYLQIDIESSEGSFSIRAGDETKEFSVQELRQARFKRWHPYAQIDLAGIKSDLIVVTPGTKSKVVVSGIIARA